VTPDGYVGVGVGIGVGVGNDFGTNVGVDIGVGVSVGDRVGVLVGSLSCCSCPPGVPVGARAPIRAGLLVELFLVSGWVSTIATEATDTSTSMAVNTIVRNLLILLTSLSFVRSAGYF
jgi:hypothetical protein